MRLRKACWDLRRLFELKNFAPQFFTLIYTLRESLIDKNIILTHIGDMRYKIIKSATIFFLVFLVLLITVDAENTTLNATESPTTTVSLPSKETIEATNPSWTIDYFITNVIKNPFVIVPTLISILILFQANKSYRLQKKIYNQGLLRTPNLIIKIYDSKLNSNFKINDFIIAGKLSPKRILQLPLTITLTNNGNKSSKKIRMEMVYPKRLRGGGMGKVIHEGFPKENPPKVFENRNFQTVMYEMDMLTPKQAFVAEEFITIMESTDYKRDVEAVTKDGVRVVVTTELYWANRIDYVIYQDDFEPISGSFAIRFVDTSNQSLKDYLNSYNEQIMKKHKEKIGKLHALKLFFYGEGETQMIQIIDYDKSKVKQNSKMPIDEVHSLTYSFGLKDGKGCISLLNSF